MDLAKRISSYAVAGLAVLFSILELTYFCTKDYGTTSVKVMHILSSLIIMLVAMALLGLVIVADIYKKNRLLGIVDFALAFYFMFDIIANIVYINKYESAIVYINKYVSAKGYYAALLLLGMVYMILTVLSGLAFMFDKAKLGNVIFKAIFVGYFAVEYFRNIFTMMMGSGSNKFLSYFAGSTMAMITIALLLIAVNNLKGGNEE